MPINFLPLLYRVHLTYDWETIELAYRCTGSSYYGSCIYKMHKMADITKLLTSMSVLLIVWPKCKLAVLLHAASW